MKNDDDDNDDDYQDAPLEDVPDLPTDFSQAGPVTCRRQGDTLEVAVVQMVDDAAPSAAEVREQQQAERELRHSLRADSEALHTMHLVCLLADARQWSAAAADATLQALVASLLPAGFFRAFTVALAVEVADWLASLLSAAPIDQKEDNVIVLSSDDDEAEEDNWEISAEDSVLGSKILALLAIVRRRGAPRGAVVGAECAAVTSACFAALGFCVRMVTVLAPLPLRPRKIPLLGRQQKNAAPDSRDGCPPAKRRKKNDVAPVESHTIAAWWWCEVRPNGSAEWMHVDVERGFLNSRRKVAAAVEVGGGDMTYVVAVEGAAGVFTDITTLYSPNVHFKNPNRVSDAWWNTTLRDCSAVLVDESEYWGGPGGPGSDGRDALVMTAASAVVPIDIGAADSIDIGQSVPSALNKLKGHRLYCLESQLTTAEMLHPKGAVQGYVKGQPVYLRRNVQELRTRDSWLKIGRQILTPDLEPARIVLRKSAGERELYGAWQTQPFDPPCAQNGRVPTNEHGTVTLFRPEMLPKGCVHLQEEGMAAVAQKLGIHFGKAIVGFTFHGKRSVPDLDGIVVCAEFETVLLEAWQAVHVAKMNAQATLRQRRAMLNWKKALDFVVTRIRLQKRHASLRL